MFIELLVTMLCSVSNGDYNPTKSEQREVAICNRHVTNATKNAIYRDAGIADHTGYCINHIVPLAIGGSNHRDNLEAMEVAPNGCHSPGELEAIHCFTGKTCSQEEAINIVLDAHE